MREKREALQSRKTALTRNSPTLLSIFIQYNRKKSSIPNHWFDTFHIKWSRIIHKCCIRDVNCIAPFSICIWNNWIAIYWYWWKWFVCIPLDINRLWNIFVSGCCSFLLCLEKCWFSIRLCRFWSRNCFSSIFRQFQYYLPPSLYPIVLPMNLFPSNIRCNAFFPSHRSLWGLIRLHFVCVELLHSIPG